MQLFGNLFGYVALIIFISMFWQKNRTLILTFSFLESVLYGLHYCILDGLTGGIIDIFLAFISLIYLQKNKAKGFNSIYIPILFAILFIVITLLTYNGIESILILIAGLISVLCDFSDDEKIIRIGGVLSQILWLSYSIALHSIPGIIGDSLVLISAIFAIITIDILKKKTSD